MHWSVHKDGYLRALSILTFATKITADLVASDTIAEAAVEPSATSHSFDNVTAIRPLEWGQLNIIHTTDTHGWLPGHYGEPNFSADWGDYISFIHHMRKRADELGVDVLVVDTGDRHDGNGLSDATEIDGALSQLIFRRADLDVVIMGNHELYKSEILQQEYDVLASYYGNRYLSSNVDILVGDSWVPVGPRYKLITTKNQGLKVLALGFMYNFETNCINSRVQHVEEVVDEEWFQEAMGLDFDFVLLTTHIPIRHFTELDIVIQAIRAHRPTTPIQALGGHSHIRDYVIYDENTTALESGRFLETVGWASIDNVKGKPEFSRAYIDFNLRSLTTHCATSLDPESDNLFQTQEGIAVKEEIADYRQQLNLTAVTGCVPHTYYADRAAYPSKYNLYSLIEEKILPTLEGVSSAPRFIYTNTGSIRYDLVKGPFTKDTGFIVSPFPSSWYYIPQVPRGVADQVLGELNRRDYIIAATATERRLDFNELGVPSVRDPPDSADHSHLKDLLPMGHFGSQAYLSFVSQLTGGYVTHDDMGLHGDDTPHQAWPRYSVPNAIEARDGVTEDTAHIDIVFNDFMRPFIRQVFTNLGSNHLVSSMQPYGGDSVIDLLSAFFATDQPCNS